MKCEQCGCEHDGSYGSGRFCSDHCKRVWCGISASRKPTHKPNMHIKKRLPYGTWTCKKCGKVFAKKTDLKKHNHDIHNPLSGKYNKGGVAWNRGKTKETDERVAIVSKTIKERYESGVIVSHMKGKKVCQTTRLKISDSMKKAIKEGRAAGWMSRKIMSYPETFWSKVLKESKIEYKANFPVSLKSLGEASRKSYFLDFLLPGNVDLEIDGGQHHIPERMKSDKIRDDILSRHGYIIYRIEWNDIRSTKGKIEMTNKIACFKSWFFNFMHSSSNGRT